MPKRQSKRRLISRSRRRSRRRYRDAYFLKDWGVEWYDRLYGLNREDLKEEDINFINAISMQTNFTENKKYLDLLDDLKKKPIQVMVPFGTYAMFKGKTVPKHKQLNSVRIQDDKQGVLVKYPFDDKVKRYEFDWETTVGLIRFEVESEQFKQLQREALR